MKDKRMVSRSCSSFSFFEERWLRCNSKKNSDWLRRDDPSVLDPRRCLVRSKDFFLLFSWLRDLLYDPIMRYLWHYDFSISTSLVEIAKKKKRNGRDKGWKDHFEGKREREDVENVFDSFFELLEDLFSLFLIYNSLVFLCLCKSMVS